MPAFHPELGRHQVLTRQLARGATALLYFLPQQTFDVLDGNALRASALMLLVHLLFLASPARLVLLLRAIVSLLKMLPRLIQIEGQQARHGTPLGIAV